MKHPRHYRPPVHPRCCSVVVGSLKADGDTEGQRAARDERGKYTRMPASMKYEDWFKTYIKPMSVKLADMPEIFSHHDLDNGIIDMKTKLVEIPML